MTKGDKWETMHSTGTNTWCTPRDFYEQLNLEFKFNLDPTCSERSKKCQLHFTQEDDCLSKSWQKYVVETGTSCVAFMNPPFGKPEHACRKNCKKKVCQKRGYHVDKYVPGQVDFVRKAAEESHDGATVVALLPARTDTEIFHDLILCKPNVEVRFLAGRLTFEEDKEYAEGEEKVEDPCPFPLMVVVFHPWHQNTDPRPFEVKSMTYLKINKTIEEVGKVLRAAVQNSLVGGGPLIVENLDLSGIGMYTDEQKLKMLAEGAPEDDFFLKTLMGTTMWARKSDEGKKWHVYDDKNLKLWKDLVKP